ncbi:MAG: hypothetical protein RLZZ399_963 [Verrucomicrobiota bacterium]|jgi:hypothetical protein
MRANLPRPRERSESFPSLPSPGREPQNPTHRHFESHQFQTYPCLPLRAPPTNQSTRHVYANDTQPESRFSVTFAGPHRDASFDLRRLDFPTVDRHLLPKGLPRVHLPLAFP